MRSQIVAHQNKAKKQGLSGRSKARSEKELKQLVAKLKARTSAVLKHVQLGRKADRKKKQQLDAGWKKDDLERHAKSMLTRSHGSNATVANATVVNATVAMPSATVAALAASGTAPKSANQTALGTANKTATVPANKTALSDTVPAVPAAPKQQPTALTEDKSGKGAHEQQPATLTKEKSDRGAHKQHLAAQKKDKSGKSPTDLYLERYAREAGGDVAAASNSSGGPAPPVPNKTAGKAEPTAIPTAKSALASSIQTLKLQINSIRGKLEKTMTDAGKIKIEKDLIILVGKLKVRTAALLAHVQPVPTSGKQETGNETGSTNAARSVAGAIAAGVAAATAETVAGHVARQVANEVAENVAESVVATAIADVSNGTAVGNNSNSDDDTSVPSNETVPPPAAVPPPANGADDAADDAADALDDNCAVLNDGICDEAPFGRWCVHGSDAVDCAITCDHGSVRTPAGCEPCGAGSFPFPFELPGMPAWCDPCPPGTFAGEGMTDCVRRPA